MLDRLTDEHPVKGIPMKRWQLIQIQRGLLFKGNSSNPVAFTLGRNKALRRLWQG